MEDALEQTEKALTNAMPGDKVSPVIWDRSRRVEEESERLKSLLKDLLQAKYGSNPDNVIRGRFEEEWKAYFEKSDYEVQSLAALMNLTDELREKKLPYWVTGQAGSSFFLYLLGITQANPLPPHEYCPACGHVIWLPEYDRDRNRNRDGFDDPAFPYLSICPVCGGQMIANGHNMTFPGNIGSDTMGKSFEVRTVQSVLPHEDTHILKRPGLSIVASIDETKVGKDYATRKYGAAEWRQFLERDDCKEILLGGPHYREHTGVNAVFEDGYVPPVKTFADLVSFMGISIFLGAGIWDDISKVMVREMGYSLSGLIVFRDDVAAYFMDHGLSKAEAWNCAKNSWRRDTVMPVTEEMMTDRDCWVLKRLQRTKVLPCRAHVLEYLFFLMRSGQLD